MNHVTYPLGSADISILSPEISKFAISRNTDVDFILYIIYNSFNFLESKDCLNKPGYNFDDVNKIAVQGLLKIKVF